MGTRYCCETNRHQKPCKGINVRSHGGKWYCEYHHPETHDAQVSQFFSTVVNRKFQAPDVSGFKRGDVAPATMNPEAVRRMRART